MSIGAIGSAQGSFSTQALQRKPEAAEVPGAKDKDGDSDDGGARAASSSVSPTVNMSGQSIGQVINTKA